MDIERLFMSCYKMEKEPDDIFNLIHFALCVGAFKYPQQFQKRKASLINFLMHPSMKSAIADDDSVSDDDEEEEEEEEVIDGVGTQEVIDGIGTQQITVQSDKPLTEKKIRIVIKKTTVQDSPLKKHNNCNAVIETTENMVPELKTRSDTDLVQQQLDDADKQGTPQSHNTTTMASRKRMSMMNESSTRVQVAPPRVKQLLSDFSFEKQLDGDKQSHKGFKKMENDHDTEKKREEGPQQTPTQRRRKERTTGTTKSMLPPLMTMNAEVAPPPHPKQSNCRARPTQKDTQSVTDMKKKFESSKRKFEERLADQREAKRRIVMVDFHDMPKPDTDPRAPKRCWNRRRF